MSPQPFWSAQTQKLKHLQAQREHLQFVSGYHLSLANDTIDPSIRTVHQEIYTQLFETINQLDQLIQIIQRPPAEEKERVSPSETLQAPPIAYEDVSIRE